MAKKTIGAATYLYPMPTVIVGCKVEGKPNFCTVAYCGVVQHNPPLVQVSLGRLHHSIRGIKENGCFSVNIPSSNMVALVDHIGLVTGKFEDKSHLFRVFYGELREAPLIEECGLNLECRLIESRDWGGTNETFTGEVLQTHIDESLLTRGLPDIRKLDPIIFSMHDNHYWRLGDELGRAWEIGQEFAKEKG